MASLFIRSLRLAAHKQYRSSVRLWQKLELRKVALTHPRGCRLMKLIVSGTVGGGTSCAFLGLSFGNKVEEDDADNLTKLYRRARLAHHRQEFEKADELYHEALKMADDLLKKEEITKEKHVTTRTVVFDGLADIALKTGQIETARTLIIETMKGCIQQGMEKTHNVIIELSLKLASIYALVGKNEEAEEGYRYCVEVQSEKMKSKEEEWLTVDGKKGKILDQKADNLEESVQDTAVLMGMSLGSFGRFLLHEKRFKEALPYFERARLYALHTLGTNSNQYIVMLNDIATLHIVTKDYDKAEDILRDALTISEKGKLEEGAMLYCNLGAVHLRRGHTAEANKACQKGSDLARQFDHTLAFKMADACLKKCASIKPKAS